MIVLHASCCPELVCKDASLASQSQKASTLVTEILKRFTATGVMPNVHHPSESLDPQAFPESFVDGMNSLTERKGGYDDENLPFFEGIKRDFDGVVASTDVSGSATGETIDASGRTIDASGKTIDASGRTIDETERTE